jgi:hypothetical protein
MAIDGKQVKNLSNPTGTGKYLNESGQYVNVPGGTSWANLALTVPFPAKTYFQTTIANASVTATSVIELLWQKPNDFAENDPELIDLEFKAVASVGGFDVIAYAKDQNVFAGQFFLKYKIS